jgi:ABC-type phosphate/phosphonate transport system permease subunit
MATLAGAAGDELEPRRDGLTRSRARFLLTVVALALFYSASWRLAQVATVPATIILLILVTVTVIDHTSAWLRRKLE